MSDGLKFLTCGGCEELIVGNDYAATIGMTNYTYIGTETTLNLGLTNDINWGAKFSIEGGQKFEWSHVSGCTLEEGHVFELGNTVAKQVGESLTFTAGYGAGPAAIAEANLNELQSKLKTAVKTMTFLNFSAGLVTSGLMTGLSDGESEQEGWEPILGAMVEAAVLAKSTEAVYKLLLSSMKALTDAYKVLEKVSTMTMDKTGIKQLVDFGVDNTNSSMILAAEGASLNAGLYGVAAGVPVTGVDPVTGMGPGLPLSKVCLLADGNATLLGDLSVTITSPIVKLGMVPDGVLSAGLSATEAEVVLKNADTAVTLTELTAGIRSPTISNTTNGVNGFVVDAQKTQMTFGTAAVKATANGLSMAMGGAGQIVFNPGVVKVSLLGVLRLG